MSKKFIWIIYFIIVSAFMVSVPVHANRIYKGNVFVCKKKTVRVKSGRFTVSKWSIENPEIAGFCKKGRKSCILAGKTYGKTRLFYKVGKRKYYKIIYVDNPKVEKSVSVKKGKYVSVVVTGVHKATPVRYRISSKYKKYIRFFRKYRYKLGHAYCMKLEWKGLRVGKAKVVFSVSGKKLQTIFEIKKVGKKRIISHTGVVNPDDDASGKSLYGDIVIEKGCKIIPVGYCADNKNITSVTIPSSVVSIESFAFSGCTNLQKVTIQGNGLKYIRYAAFNLCQPGLKEFPVLPDSVEIIEDHAFCHTNSAAFANGKFHIPKNLKLIGMEYLKNGGKFERNPGNVTTHVFYDTGGKSLSPLIAFEGESKNYIAVDGVLYRKNNTGKPVFLIAVPSGKKQFNQFDYATGSAEGIYVMPNTVTGAAELSLNNYNDTMKKVVFSDGFDISRRLSVLESGEYNCSMYVGSLWKGKSYANATSIIGGYGNVNLESYDVRRTNWNYREYENCIFSKDYKVLWAVPPCIREVILHDQTTAIDSGAFQQSLFGTPYNINTGADYYAWVNDSAAKSDYSGERKIVKFSYAPKSFSLLSKSKSVMSVAERIVYHTITVVLKNSNKRFTIVTC